MVFFLNLLALYPRYCCNLYIILINQLIIFLFIIFLAIFILIAIIIIFIINKLDYTFNFNMSIINVMNIDSYTIIKDCLTMIMEINIITYNTKANNIKIVINTDFIINMDFINIDFIVNKDFIIVNTGIINYYYKFIGNFSYYFKFIGNFNYFITQDL